MAECDAASKQYLLNRDAKESARLIDQNEWLKQLLGCTVHPSIPLLNDNTTNTATAGTTNRTATLTGTPDQPLRIADVATGTAVWLLDLAAALPAETTQLFGFDISAAQFPAPEGRPANLTLREHNVTEAFPDEFLGSFDVVAVRLITAGLRGDDWDKAVRNVSALLKPGGYLQWIEPLHATLQVFNAAPGAPNLYTRKALTYFHEGYNATLAPGPIQLPALCDAHGLGEELALESFPSDRFPDREKVRAQGKAFLSGACVAMMKYIVAAEAKGGDGGVTEEGVRDVVGRAMKELDGEVFLRSEMQVMVRRKTA